jgi:hypothetical protein
MKRIVLSRSPCLVFSPLIYAETGRVNARALHPETYNVILSLISFQWISLAIRSITDTASGKLIL